MHHSNRNSKNVRVFTNFTGREFSSFAVDKLSWLFLGIPQPLQENAGIVLLISPWYLSFTFFSIKFSHTLISNRSY
jgi:hypothetical protein